MTAPLIKHFEDHLGPIVGGWDADANGKKLPFQIVRFDAIGADDASALATLGLSNTPLNVNGGPNTMRQELMILFKSSDGPRNLPGVLQQVALGALASHKAYALGDVVGPSGELVQGSTLTSVYVALPIFWTESFQICRATSAPVVVGWLVPITTAEAAFIRTHGLEAFEKTFDAARPDILDFKRATTV